MVPKIECARCSTTKSVRALIGDKWFCVKCLRKELAEQRKENKQPEKQPAEKRK